MVYLTAIYGLRSTAYGLSLSQGVSVLVSSGDDGVANFQARAQPSSCGYNPR
jgi:hypothetical protein